MHTRSNLDLRTTSIVDLIHLDTYEEQQSIIDSSPNLITTMNVEQDITELNKHHESNDNSFRFDCIQQLNLLREYENQRLNTIRLLTIEELRNIDQWLLHVHNIFEELQYPQSSRVHQATNYFQDDERIWYDHERNTINNDWSCFCIELKQNVYHRLYSTSSYPETGPLDYIIKNHFIKYTGIDDAKQWLFKTVNQFKEYQLPESAQLQVVPLLLDSTALIWYKQNENLFISMDKFCELFLQNFITIDPVPVTVNSTLTSDLSITMARELIRTPIYFRGSQDDIFEWLEKLEQRFKMANWNDENKIRYISLHLQDDAYKWWTQASKSITTWTEFVNDIKQAFVSTKMKEVAFEQLRRYKQSVIQSITQYYNKVIELCSKVDYNMPDLLKLQYLMGGVKDSLKLHIALHDPQISDSFLSYARKLEDTLSFTDLNQEVKQFDDHRNIDAIHQSPITSSTFERQRMTYPHISTRFQRFQTSSNNKNALCNKKFFSSESLPDKLSKRSSVICYTCGTPDHYARECTRYHFS